MKGLIVGKHRGFLDELLAAFQKIGYTIRLPWQVLNAADFGVPQNRARFILMGSRNEQECPNYPQKKCSRHGTQNPSLAYGPTCLDALGDLPEVEAFPELQNVDSVLIRTWKELSPYATLMRCLNDDGWGYGYRRHWRTNLLTASMRTNHSAISRRRFSETKPGQIEPISRFFKSATDGISNTLRASTDSSRGAFTSPRPIHYAWPRCITVREMARLHGFPDWFRFHVTKWHGARQIGNAVAPPLARAIADELISAAHLNVFSPLEVLQSGSNFLLEMDMTQASKNWNVPVPIASRNQKSGARKRKQEAIEAILIKDRAHV